MTGDDGSNSVPRGTPRERLRHFRLASAAANSGDDARERTEALLLLQATVLEGMCRRVAKKYGIDRDDLAQEVRLSILRKCDVDDTHKGAMNFLFQRVEWTAQDIHKRSEKRPETATDPALLPYREPSPFGSDAGIDAVTLNDLKRRFNLGSKEAEVLALRIGGLGLTLKEIARRLDRTDVSVRKLHQRAVEKVSRTLGESEELEVFKELMKTGNVDETARRLSMRPEDVAYIASEVQKKIDDTMRGWR